MEHFYNISVLFIHKVQTLHNNIIILNKLNEPDI